MKEHPILFNGEMVRAVLDGRKTQTRRVFKVPAGLGWYVSGSARGEATGDLHDLAGSGWCSVDELACPHGMPGDRLWVRETFFAYGRWETRYSEKKGRDKWHFVDLTAEMDRRYQYEDPTPTVARHRRSSTPAWWRRPSIFMPRAATRTLLDVTCARVERVQSITENDAEAEGTVAGAYEYDNGEGTESARESFQCLWDSINAANGHGWDANPWVWVLEFKRVGGPEQ
ncbi:hypothetical protein DIE15_08210 [Burkholderia sp. Bp9031]|uniref:hypothetical protein n=1 Tax=Burkholderia sp. Bp9031 TaxID=2184566 RepID=UPI000F602CFD|nr:hypothetical protein [Burkholderia sp. Bp9031]RQZ18107.1 hypothetical protein DIE15_08210 [Burkholderia sp. Bp9031]